MITRTGNVRLGRTKRAATFVLPAMCALLGATGVTTKPMLGMREVESSVELARARATACSAARERVARFEAAGGLAAVDAAIASVTEVLPEALRPIDVHALVTLCLAGRGVEVVSLSVLDRRDSRHPALADAVAETPVEVRGTARLSAIAGLVDELRRAGLPAALVEFSITRADPGSEQFECRLVLSIFQRVPVSPEPATSPGEDPE